MRPSSNAYANGSDQNRGNYITSTPTTRVLKPPGGGSSICLGWGGGDDPVPEQRRGGRRPRNVCEADAGGRGNYSQPAPPAKQFEPREFDPRAHARAQQGGSADIFGSGSGCRDSPKGYCGESRRPAQAQPPMDDYDREAREEQYYRGEEQFHEQRMAQREQRQDADDSYGMRRSQDEQWMRRSQDEQAMRHDHSEHAMRGSGSAFGARPRMGSNNFATGSNQNCGNMITERRTTRVNAPPGGRSSFSIGWSGDSGDNVQQQRGQGRRRFGNVSESQERFSPRGNEVEGARPRGYKPSIRLNAPPGGAGAFSPDWNPSADRQAAGGDGAGCRDDAHAREAYRYYQAEDQRMGKQSAQEYQNHAEKVARDTHRYYLDDEVPGPGRCGVEARPQPILAWSSGREACAPVN